MMSQIAGQDIDPEVLAHAREIYAASLDQKHGTEAFEFAAYRALAAAVVFATVARAWKAEAEA